MARAGNRRGGRPDGIHVASYRGRLSLVALVAALVACAAVLIVERVGLNELVSQLRAPHPHLDVSGVALLARVGGVSLLFAVITYLLADMAIRLLRVAIYLRTLHTYAGRMLHTYGPLLSLGYDARLSELKPDGQQPGSASLRAIEYLSSSRRTLLVGESGAGKSDALWGVAFELTRRRMWLRVFAGAASLPIIAPMSSLAESRRETDEALTAFLARQLRVFSTAGLAARLERRMKRSPTLLLCDDLDALTPGQRRVFAADLKRLDNGAKRPIRIVATVGERSYKDEPTIATVFHDFTVARLRPVVQHDVVNLLRRVKGSVATRPGRPALVEALARHRLGDSLRTPAILTALVTVWRDAKPLPYGRAQLWARALSADSRGATSDDQAMRSDALAQFASALLRADVTDVPIPAGRSLGRAVVEWLAMSPPLYPLDHQMSESSDLSPEQIEVRFRAALRAGVLARSPDGLTLRFANHPLLDAYAARWLCACDDALGRLNAELLQPQWIAPTLLWGGMSASPGDIASRLTRLADTPDATAIRANLPTSEDAQPAALALACAVAAEGLACQLAESADASDAYPRMVMVAEQHLRDLLDQAAVYSSEPERQDRLSSSLRSIQRVGGDEVVASVAVLARTSALSRLARARLIALLGVLASAQAVAVCVEMLTETDPTLRQAVNQAISYAGPAALEPLRAALRDPDEHVRMRAAEGLSLLGDVAVETAVGALQGTDARQRAAAVRTVGALGARQAVDAVIARLDDGDGTVRVAAARALGQLATAEAVTALANHVTTPDTGLRVALAKALGATHAPDALPALLALLDDPDGQVRAATATALGVLGDDRAAAPLRRRANDRDALAQNAALAALRRLGRA